MGGFGRGVSLSVNYIIEMKKELPFFAIGNDELEKLPSAPKSVVCEKCNKKHKIKYGTTKGVENKNFGFISCGTTSYLVSINGKLLK